MVSLCHWYTGAQLPLGWSEGLELRLINQHHSFRGKMAPGKTFLKCKTNDIQPCSPTKINKSSSSKLSLYDNSFLLQILALLSPVCLTFCRQFKSLGIKHPLTFGGNQLDQATLKVKSALAALRCSSQQVRNGRAPRLPCLPLQCWLLSHHQEPPQTPPSSFWPLILHGKGILCSTWSEKENWSLFNWDALCPGSVQNRSTGRYPEHVPKSQTILWVTCSKNKHKAAALHIHSAHLPLNFAALTFLNKSPDWKGNYYHPDFTLLWSSSLQCFQLWRRKSFRKLNPLQVHSSDLVRTFLIILFLVNELLWFSHGTKEIFLMEKIQRIFTF